MNSRTSSSTAGTASTHFMALLPIISDRRRRVRAADQLHKQTSTPGGLARSPVHNRTPLDSQRGAVAEEGSAGKLSSRGSRCGTQPMP